MQKLAVFGGTGIIEGSITEYLDTQDDWQGIDVVRHKQQIFCIDTLEQLVGWADVF